MGAGTMTRADILLVYPPYEKIDFVSSIPYLAGYAREKGFDVDALDSLTLGLTVKEIIAYVKQTRPRSVGVSIPFTPLAKSGLELVKELNRVYPDLPLIVGGVHPTLCPDEFTKYATVCIGYGERSLVRFLETMDIYKQWNIKTPKLKINTLIEEIAVPEWNSVEADDYKLVLPTGDRAAPIQTSRGCMGKCVFCASPILSGGRVRFKTIDQVKNEIGVAVRRFGVWCFSFRDENFTLNKERFKEICAYLKSIKAGWWAQARADLINREMADIARDSGCLGFSIGVETGDAHIMKMIKKGVTLENVEEAFKMLRAAGLLSCGLFMLGHAGDTPETVKNTLDFADKIDPDYFGIVIATPFPGTEFRAECLRQGAELSEDWSDYVTNKVTYTPPGLAGYDLLKMLNKIEFKWYARKPKRILVRVRGSNGFRAKLRFLRRLWRGR